MDRGVATGVSHSLEQTEHNSMGKNPLGRLMLIVDNGLTV